MKKNRRLEQISNGYYNLGLSLAKERNLSSALNALSISLGLNKKNTDARNLYGLIQFEMGEETKALISWVISININPIILVRNITIALYTHYLDPHLQNRFF